MTQENDQTLILRSKANPWVYSILFGSGLLGLVTFRDAFGALLALIIFGLIALRWLIRTQGVIINFETKEATFFKSELNPFYQRRVISLANYSRVYATPFHENGGWSLQLSGPKGEHLLLAKFPQPFSGTSTDDAVRALCSRIASGLNIKDGRGA